MCQPQPSVADFHEVSPDVLLDDEPWGHVDHAGATCGWRSADWTGAYVNAVASGHIGSSTYGDTAARVFR